MPGRKITAVQRRSHWPSRGPANPADPARTRITTTMGTGTHRRPRPQRARARSGEAETRRPWSAFHPASMPFRSPSLPPSATAPPFPLRSVRSPGAHLPPSSPRSPIAASRAVLRRTVLPRYVRLLPHAVSGKLPRPHQVGASLVPTCGRENRYVGTTDERRAPAAPRRATGR